jgi:hypothetical protein
VNMRFGRYGNRPPTVLPADYLEWLHGLGRASRATGALVRLSGEGVPVADALVTAGYRALALQHHPDAGGAPA